MRGKGLISAAALAVALAAGIGGPAQAAAPGQDPPETETVYVWETVGAYDPPRDITATCPAGMKAISGGGMANDGRNVDWKTEATPDGTGWVMHNAGHASSPGGNPSPYSWRVHVVCACAD